MEEWKDIKGYEGKYQVSNLGNVKSLNYNNTGKPRNLKIKINHFGFSEVKLSKNDKKKSFMVARLVAEAFMPTKQINKKVTHIDNNKQNNRVDNLKWVHESEMKYLMYERGNREVGVPSGNKISYKGKEYKTFTELAEDYGISSRNLFKRLNRGWSLEEALEIKVAKKNCGGKPLSYEYYGEMLTLAQIAEKNNIREKTIRKRISRGWNIYEASEIPIKKG